MARDVVWVWRGVVGPSRRTEDGGKNGSSWTQIDGDKRGQAK